MIGCIVQFLRCQRRVDKKHDSKTSVLKTITLKVLVWGHTWNSMENLVMFVSAGWAMNALEKEYFLLKECLMSKGSSLQCCYCKCSKLRKMNAQCIWSLGMQAFLNTMLPLCFWFSLVYFNKLFEYFLQAWAKIFMNIFQLNHSPELFILKSVYIYNYWYKQF